MDGSAPPALLEGEPLSRGLASITFSFPALIQSRACFLKAAWTLQRRGVIRLCNVASPSDIDAINKRTDQLLERIHRLRTTGIVEEPITNAYLNLPGRLTIRGYKQLVHADRSVINLRFSRPDGRSGSDAGMIDIFHPQKLSRDFRHFSSRLLQEKVIRALIRTSSLCKVQTKCRNLYINDGVQDTRGFHCDGRSTKFKSFLFLSDVEHLEDGPYCYVSGSHHNDALWQKNRVFNEANGIDASEFTQLRGIQAIPLFANAGDMVISSQAGAHRGHPQTAEGSRRVLVAMYSPKSAIKLSRRERMNQSLRRWITTW